MKSLGHLGLRRILAWGAVLALGAGIGSALRGSASAISGGAQSAVRKTGKMGNTGKTNSAANAAHEAAMPFRIGEKLDYRVAWANFSSAAAVELTVPERRNLMGWGTWHFRASAHTLSPMRSLFAMDDQIDSYTDTATLESRQYETYLNEMGKKEDQILHFLPEGESGRGNAAQIVVSPGTRDPLGAIYALRGVDWERTPEFHAPVYDGHDVYEMRARLDVPSETIAVAAGNFSASKISVRLYQRGVPVQGMSFVAWLARDAARTPVLLEAQIPFGSLRVELVSAAQ